MPGKVVHFEIPADNVERVKVFYEKAFGWQINKYPGMEYHGLGTTPVDQKTQMPTEPGAINGGMTKRQDPVKNTVITIDVSDIDSALRTVEKLGRLRQVKVLFETALTTLGQETDLVDLNDDEFVGDIVSGLVEAHHNSRITGGYRPYDFYLSEYTRKLRRMLKGEVVDRIPTGFKSFDAATGGGLPLPGLTILGGNPGSGKTQWAIQAARNVASRIRDSGAKGVVAVNSIEMTGSSVVGRLILSSAEIDSALLRSGGYKKDKAALRRISEEVKHHAGLPIVIDDSDMLTSKMIGTRAAGLLSQYGSIPLMVTDFAEMVSDPGDNPEQRVAQVFLNARGLGKRLSCSHLMISQLSRGVELSGSRVPDMRHLRYSGMAEAVADLVLLNYYPYQYIKRGVKITPHPSMPPEQGIAYVIIAKHKDGDTGFLPMGWQDVYTLWGDRKSQLGVVDDIEVGEESS